MDKNENIRGGLKPFINSHFTREDLKLVKESEDYSDIFENQDLVDYQFQELSLDVSAMFISLIKKGDKFTTFDEHKKLARGLKEIVSDVFSEKDVELIKNNDELFDLMVNHSETYQKVLEFEHNIIAVAYDVIKNDGSDLTGIRL